MRTERRIVVRSRNEEHAPRTLTGGECVYGCVCSGKKLLTKMKYLYPPGDLRIRPALSSDSQQQKLQRCCDHLLILLRCRDHHPRTQKQQAHIKTAGPRSLGTWWPAAVWGRSRYRRHCWHRFNSLPVILL